MYISIHAPLTGSDTDGTVDYELNHISIHAPLTGSDIKPYTLRCNFCDFNPRSPHRERLGDIVVMHSEDEFQSTLPSQGATIYTVSINAASIISIHAPLTGSDFLLFSAAVAINNFNPRSPHRERQSNIKI